MNSEEGVGASIWLLPSKDIISILNPIISRLSQKYGSPLFEPHITLCKKIKLKNNSVDVFKKTFRDSNEFEVDVNGINQYSEYFKCVFLSLNMSENFKDFQRKSTSVFKSEINESNPHISLIYANISEDERQKLVDSLSEELKDLKKIRVKKLKLYLTQGSIYSWRELASISLKKI